MSAFEIAVPLVALAVAAIGALLLRREARNLDKRAGRRHPAE